MTIHTIRFPYIFLSHNKPETTLRICFPNRIKYAIIDTVRGLLQPASRNIGIERKHMRRQKYLIPVLSIILSLSFNLNGCGQKENIKETTEETAAESETEAYSMNKETTEITEVTEIAENTTGTEEPAGTQTPLALHGALHVEGTSLTDSHGNPIQLRGMSTHGIAWFPEYINYETFRYLRDDWNTNCIRLAMYTAEPNGYCSDGNQEDLKNLVKSGVEYASELGMYVIIDWHILSDQNPLTYKTEAIQFFDEMSKRYADYDNVLYEICNEPNNAGTWDTVCAYANEVIPVIRANNSRAVILVGTPTWSQDIDQALAAPLDYENIMYVLHFYAATHTDWLRERMKNCIESGLPVFVSEFGICDASGNGAVDTTQGNAWKELIETYNVSYLCWNLANKNESSSILVPGCPKLYDWNDEDLSEPGRWIRDWFLSETE